MGREREACTGANTGQATVTPDSAVPTGPSAIGFGLQFPDRSMEASFWAQIFAVRGRILPLTLLLILVLIPFMSPAFVPHLSRQLSPELRWLDMTLTTLAVGVPFLSGLMVCRRAQREDRLVYFFAAAALLASLNYCVLLMLSGPALIGFYTYSMLHVLLLMHLFLAIPFRILLVISPLACLAYALTLLTFTDVVPLGELLFALSPVASFALVLLYVSYIMEQSARLNFLYVNDLSRGHQRRLQRRENDARFLALTADFLGSQLRSSVARLADDLAVIEKRGVNEKQSHYLQRAAGSIDFMDRLVDETYSSTTLESVLAGIVTTPTDLAELVQLQASAYRDLYPAHRFTVSAPEPLVAPVDRQRLLQALDKIVHNATEHSAAGSVIRLSVSRAASASGLALASDSEALIVVGNAGSILEDAERIFSPYVSSKQGKDNVGIGLFIVRRIIESHGGTVLARGVSEPPGAEFLIRLPTVGE